MNALRRIFTSKLHVKSLCSSAAVINDNLEIKTAKGPELFPLIWLRDNCPCEKCFDEASNSRIINWSEHFSSAVKNIEEGPNRVKITWSDNHPSVYTLEWLKARSFRQEAREERLKSLTPPKTLWSKEGFDQVAKFVDFDDIMTRDDALYDWLMNLAVYGVVLVKNVPKDKREGMRLVNRIAYSKTTHYGPEYYVKMKRNATNVAYIPRLLQLHTDLPFYKYKPGAIFLHCLEQTKTKGGENLLIDGLHLAEKLRAENRAVFDVLAKTPVNWFDEGTDYIEFNKVYRQPVIILNSEGKVESINHNIARRDSVFTQDVRDVKEWFKALRVFVDKLNENASEFKLQPGQILAFDNTRLLHGRTSYEDTADVQRFLVGIYVDWDEIYSKIRTLKAKLNKNIK